MRLAPVIFGLVLLLAGEAAAAQPRRDRIELRHLPRSRVEEVRVEDLVPPAWRAPAVAPVFVERRGPIELRMPALAAETLDLKVRTGRLELSVSADLGSDLTPRLDCSSNDTYFWCRASFDLGRKLNVFVESFQGASSILGPNPFVTFPSYAWDGVQLQTGARVRLTRCATFEGGPVLYALSASRRPEQLGARLALSLDF